MTESNHKHWMFRDRAPFFKGVRIAGKVVFGIAAAAVFALVFGVLVMLLWNWLMPLIFGLPEITYWQAFGIVILVKLVFGTIGQRHDHSDWRRPRDRWKNGEPKGHDWMQAGENQHWQYWRDFWKDEGRDVFEKYIRRRGAEDHAASDGTGNREEP